MPKVIFYVVQAFDMNDDGELAGRAPQSVSSASLATLAEPHTREVSCGERVGRAARCLRGSSQQSTPRSTPQRATERSAIDLRTGRAATYGRSWQPRPAPPTTLTLAHRLSLN
jgi:hypothetical protein